MSIVLDASVLIADERGTWDAARFASEFVGSRRLAICAITASEFLHGCWRAPVGKRRERREAFFTSLLESVEVLPFGYDEAYTHSQLTAELASSGVTIGGYDLIIAATCLHLDWGLATLNHAEFARIPGLRLVATDAYRIPPTDPKRDQPAPPLP
jgi:tRNA(fMet)-specific endonuclease VapC